MKTIICLSCGTPFISSRGIYCPKCIHKRQAMAVIKTRIKRTAKTDKHCNDCGKLINWKNKTGYCHKCLFANHRYGENCPAWRGGRKKDKDGYIFIYHPNPHPHRKECSKNRGYRSTYYVAEHILNWEKYNNIPLPKGYTVHHLNGIKDDNRPKNLVALPTQTHSSGMINEALRKRIRELEEIISQGRFNI